MNDSDEISGLSVEEMVDLKSAVDMTRENVSKRIISTSFASRLDRLSDKLRKELFLNMPRADYEDMFGKEEE